MHHLRKLAFVLLLLALIVNHQALGQSCVDNDEPFVAVKPGDNGWTKMKTCDGWVSRKSTAWRCFKVAGATENCPLTCANCCEDTLGAFTLLGNGQTKSCAWAAVNPGMRCRKAPTRQLCSVTCGICAGTTPAPTLAPTPAPTPAPTTLEDFLLLIAENMFGECAINQSCDNTAENSAVTWFINTDNHPTDLGFNERVWSERLVLAVLFYETGGDQWRDKTDWLSNNHHRTWYGVTPTDSSSDNNSYVLKLYLYDNDLNGRIPTQVGQLTSLNTLFLFFNALTGSIPEVVCDLLAGQTLYADCVNCNVSKEGCCADCYSPNLESLLLNLAANMFGECATNQSCDTTAANSAVTWFINTDNHPNDLDVAVFNERFYTERLVLAVLFYETGGDLWNDKFNWMSNNHHRTWYGVTTDSSPYNAYVLKLDLVFTGLNGTIPTQMFQLTSLEVLSLEFNALAGPIPTEVGQLTSVEYLRLDGNALTGPIPTEVGHLTSLTRRLSLNNNALTGPIPTEVGQLTSLERLDFSFNALAGPIPTEVGQLTSLFALFLHSNTLTGPVPSQIGEMTSLKQVWLDRNTLTGSIPDGVCDAEFKIYGDCVNCNLSKEGCCTGRCE